jgi:hypothetical protein
LGNALHWRGASRVVVINITTAPSIRGSQGPERLHIIDILKDARRAIKSRSTAAIDAIIANHWIALERDN